MIQKNSRQKLEKIKIEDILWPIYDRNLHDVVEDQIKVTKDIILIEGNWVTIKNKNHGNPCSNT